MFGWAAVGIMIFTYMTAIGIGNKQFKQSPFSVVDVLFFFSFLTICFNNRSIPYIS